MASQLKEDAPEAPDRGAVLGDSQDISPDAPCCKRRIACALSSLPVTSQVSKELVLPHQEYIKNS